MNNEKQPHWQFGPNWSGKRCGAQLRGKPGRYCQKPALKGNNRCQIHGALGGAPSGPRNGNYKHGRYTKKAIATRKADWERVRALFRLGKKLGMFV